jgi:hypothetical protein
MPSPLWLVMQHHQPGTLRCRREGHPPHQNLICGWLLRADIVEELEFPRRSQSRRPLAGSMETSLGAQRSDRSLCVRPSLRPRCGNYPCREHYARGSRIFAVPQFPAFSTVYANSGHSPTTWRIRQTTQIGPLSQGFRTSVSHHRGVAASSSRLCYSAVSPRRIDVTWKRNAVKLRSCSQTWLASRLSQNGRGKKPLSR